MDFKNLLGKLDQLNEAEITSRKVAGKAYGGAAQHDDEDDEDEDGNKKAAAPEKRGRGRPRKAGGEADTSKRYGGAAELQRWIVGSVPKKSKELEKLGKTKHKLSDKEPTEKKKVKESLKDWIAELDMLAEAEQVTMEPAKQNTQVIKQGNKVLGQVSDPQLAQRIKQSIDQGKMSFAGSELGESKEAARGLKDTVAFAVKNKYKVTRSPDGQTMKFVNKDIGHTLIAKIHYDEHSDQSQVEYKSIDYGDYRGNKYHIVEQDIEMSEAFPDTFEYLYNQALKNESGSDLNESNYSAKAARAGKDIGKPGKQFSKIAKDAAERYGSKERGEKVAGAVLAKLRAKTNEADMPPNDALASPLTLESKRGVVEGVEVVDYDYDLDQLMFTLLVDGDKVTFTYWDYDEDWANADIKSVYAQVKERLTDLSNDQQKDVAKAVYQKIKKVGQQNLNELSKSTLGSYAKKAAADSTMRMAKAVSDNDHAAAEKAGKRYGGVIKAIDRLSTDKKDVAESKSSVKSDDKAEKAGKKVAKDIEYDEKVKDKIHGKKRHAEDENAEKAGKKVAKDIEYDEKKSKKKVDESMDHKLKAAHHRGKSHALAKEGYHCRYDEGSEEARMYHEGYKMGLDECYGVMPMRGVVVGEESEQDVVDNMASFGALGEEDMDEGNAFTAALAKTPPGGKFTVGGKTFTDRSSYDAKVDEMMMAFEGWDKQLNELLTEGEAIEEGMSISVSKGQMGAPDSVSVTASDSDADKLMALVKQMGILGGEEQASDYGVSHADQDTVKQHGDLTVVDDHDGMMALIKKVAGPGMDQGSEDYADEISSDDHSHDHGEVCPQCGKEECECGHEETCESCGGMMEAGHSCGSKEMVDEVESEDQQEFEVSEDNPPDSDEAETSADEDAEAKEDEALAIQNLEEEDEEDKEEHDGLEESFANSADDTFEADMDFMTRVISGGLNKQKSTGQTTTPVIPGQKARMGVDGMNEGAESVMDWKKLAGIK